MLRPASALDVPRLVELARRSWLSAFGQTVPFALISQWVLADRETSWYQRHWPEMLVMDDDGTVIGLVQAKGAEINGLWVHPDHQGTGAGTLLLKAGEEIIRGAGYDRAWLVCSEFNRKALAFYERRGYVVTQRDHEVHPCGVAEEMVRLESLLAVGGTRSERPGR